MTAGPLAGCRVLVTRAAEQAGPLTAALEAAGATVVQIPLLEVVPPRDPGPLEQAARRVAEYDWLAFTSANAVRTFVPRLDALPAPEAPSVAVVGDATATAATELGLTVTLQPAEGTATGLAAELTPRLVPGARVLVPQAADARPTLVRELTAAGAAVTAVVAYDKQTPADAGRRLRRLLTEKSPPHWVTFTSPRIVRTFYELSGTGAEGLPRLRTAAIGPVTAAELRRHGVEPAAVAAAPSPPALVAALTAAHAVGG